jgi:hypothetical protein
MPGPTSTAVRLGPLPEWTSPIGEARLNRHLRDHRLRQEQAKTLARIAAETGGNVQDERRRKILARGLGDHKALRGIPAIGRGVQGALPDSRPGDSLFR